VLPVINIVNLGPVKSKGQKNTKVAVHRHEMTGDRKWQIAAVKLRTSTPTCSYEERIACIGLLCGMAGRKL